METLKYNQCKGCDLLFIDDDIEEHFILEMLIGNNKWYKNLLSFDSGKKVIQYLLNLSRHDFPRLILLDYYLPVMNGKEILEYLKSQDRFCKIPVIIYSSEINDGIKSDLLSLGALACIKKSTEMRLLEQFLSTGASNY